MTNGGPPTLDFVPQVVDLNLYAGDGAAVRLVVGDGSGPFPMTGQVRAQIRQTRDAEDPALASWSADLTQAAQGVVMLTLRGDQTMALMDAANLLQLGPTGQPVRSGGTWVLLFTGAWDVEWTPTGKEPVTLLQGDVTCTLDVTR
jgi:hypothetical protein